MSMMQNELKKCGTTIESVPSDKQPTPDSIKRLDNEISSKNHITVNQGSVGCQNCEYREKYNNQLICKHKSSMEGIESIKEFYSMDEVKECDYYSYDENSVIDR